MTKSEKMSNFIPYINTGRKMKRCIIIILAMLFVSGLHAQEAKTVISAEDLINRSVTDAGAALQGKAAGLLVMNMSGAPGETARLRLRSPIICRWNSGTKTFPISVLPIIAETIMWNTDKETVGRI